MLLLDYKVEQSRNNCLIYVVMHNVRHLKFDKNQLVMTTQRPGRMDSTGGNSRQIQQLVARKTAGRSDDMSRIHSNTEELRFR